MKESIDKARKWLKEPKNRALPVALIALFFSLSGQD